MPAKRQATSDLNHQNWDQEEEPEERGTFRTATEDELKARVIKRARRRNNAEEAGKAENKSVFSNFAGFGKTSAATDGASPFAFLSKLQPDAAGGSQNSSFSFKVGGTTSEEKAKDTTDKPTFFFGSQPTQKTSNNPTLFGSKETKEPIASEAKKPVPFFSLEPKEFKSSGTESAVENTLFGNKLKDDKPTNSRESSSWATLAPKKPKESEGNEASANSAEASKPTLSSVGTSASAAVGQTTKSNGNDRAVICEQFRRKVNILNHDVVKFLNASLKKDAYCILTPVFNDYNKHLKNLQTEKDTQLSLIGPQKNSPSPGAAKVLSEKSSNLADAVTLNEKSPISTVSSSSAIFSKSDMTTPAAKVTTTSSSISFMGDTAPKPTTTFSFGYKPALTTTTTNIPKPGFFSFDPKGNGSVPDPSSSSLKKPAFSFGNKPVPTTNIEDKGTVDESTAVSKPAATFNFGNNQTLASNTAEMPKAGFFSFTPKNNADVTSPPKTNGFSFGVQNNDKQSTSPFSFGNIKPPTNVSNDPSGNEPNDDEDDTPPKAEFKQVTEDDAIYSKRCKAFVKKDNDFADCGVGMLYLKPIKDSEKIQMIMRADTSLGNILINLILTEGLPCKRMGKNNVMMVCMPTPEHTKPTTLLLRVKTGDEADDLLKIIEQHKK